MANVELYINERITNTKDKVNEISMTMSPLLSRTNRSPEENNLLGAYKTVFESALENNINAYEEACAKYLDGKVDKKRFKKTYCTEIRQLVESKDLKKYFDSITTRYKAVVKVYDEWENLEK
jgi:ribosomal protein L17